jgi:hypothetical protein
MTDSAILIGLIPAIHVAGNTAAVHSAQGFQQERHKADGHVLLSTSACHSWIGLVAWFIPEIGPKIALFLTFMFLVWQGLG